jgi:SAM-dependent methyltransferase
MQDSKEIQKKFYNKHFAKENNWNNIRFESGANYFIERFLEMAVGSGTKKILEIGCGDGFLTSFLLKRNVQITAVDISGKAIENMRHQFSEEIGQGKLKLKCADAVEFLETAEEKYDAIVGSGIIHHIKKEDWKKLFWAARKKLSPGGVFACGPEPNAGGFYSLVWPFAKFFYRLFGMDYNWEVEKGTLDMIPKKLIISLKKSGFPDPEVVPFQAIPHFHSRILAYIDKKMIEYASGRFSFYIIIKGKKP